MLPDIESLRCLVAAADHPSFRAAARNVALSPAAFGDRIKRLEELLAARLFERTTRRVTLTLEGERLLPEARACLQLAQRCVEVVRDPAEAAPFELTLGTRFELGMSWLTPALPDLEREHPERHLHLSFGDTPALLEQLRQGSVDAVVSSARITSVGLDYARLHEEQYVFVAKKQLAAKVPLRRREHCAQHTLLELNRELPLFRYFLDARAGDEVWAFRRVKYLGSIGPVRAQVLDGAGVAVLPLYFVRDALRRGRLVRLMPRVTLPSDCFRLIWRTGHPRSRELHELAGTLSRRPLS